MPTYFKRANRSPAPICAVKAEESSTSGSTETTFLLVAPEMVEQINQKMRRVSLRRDIITNSEKMFCGEIFRLLAAIVDWEQITNSSQQTIVAYKLISMFVEVGSIFENNIAPKTRNELLGFKLSGKRAKKTLFEAAKMEIMRDVLQNPSLRALLGLSRDTSVCVNRINDDNDDSDAGLA